MLLLRKNEKEQLDILERLPLPLTSLHGKYRNQLSMLYVNMNVCMYCVEKDI